MNDLRGRPLESASVSEPGVPPPPSSGTDADSSERTEAAIRAVIALEAKLDEQRATLGRLKLALVRQLVMPPGSACSEYALKYRMAEALRRLERQT